MSLPMGPPVHYDCDVCDCSPCACVCEDCGEPLNYCECELEDAPTVHNDKHYPERG
jgi:hypothetical protein